MNNMSFIPKRYYLGDDFFDALLEPAEKDQMKCDIYEKDDKYYRFAPIDILVLLQTPPKTHTSANSDSDQPSVSLPN